MAERLIKVQLINGKNIDLFSPKMIGGDILGENGKIALITLFICGLCKPIHNKRRKYVWEQ